MHSLPAQRQGHPRCVILILPETSSPFTASFFRFFLIVATLCVISIADTRPVILEIIFLHSRSFSLSLRHFGWSLLRQPDRLLAGGATRIKTVRLVFASARIYTAETVGKWPLSERQFCKKPQVVGASIARPRTRAIRIKSGVCRNFSAFRRADGQWPPLRVQDFKPLCHSENGDV